MGRVGHCPLQKFNCQLMSLQLWLECTHGVRTHAEMLLTQTFDLSTQNNTTSRIFQVYSLYQVWILWDHSFLSYLRTTAWEMHLLTMWLWLLTFQSQYHTISRISRGHFLYRFEQFGIICFWVMLRKNRQTNKQTDRRTRAFYLRVGNLNAKSSSGSRDFNQTTLLGR